MLSMIKFNKNNTILYNSSITNRIYSKKHMILKRNIIKNDSTYEGKVKNLI